jgi:hypothetical protein
LARKDLSRTVIEGGRYFHNSWERRASHGIERSRTREWLARVTEDLEEAEDTEPVPRPTVRKLFRDKLSPAYRWIDSQVGRPWNLVRAELFARFDPRTTAGQHVLFDHVLREVEQHGIVLPEKLRRGDRWYVDPHGILRRALIGGRTWREIHRDARTWAAGRKIALTERGWWWYRRTVTGPLCNNYQCGLPHYNDGERTWLRYHRLSFEAVAPLSRGDKRRLNRLPDDIYRELVVPTSSIR